MVSTPTTLLGLECGGTRSVALVTDLDGRLQARHEMGPANARLVTDRRFTRMLREVKRRFGSPRAVGVAMAGLRRAEDVRRIQRLVAEVWPAAVCEATHDLESAWLAAQCRGEISQPDPAKRGRPQARVIVLSGTGSCCYGRLRTGKEAKVGGWGHLLGDKGSGYELGLQALRAVVFEFDRYGRWTLLGRRLLRALQMNTPEELIAWAQAAGKDAIAALAPEVVAAWRQRDRIAGGVVRACVSSLASDAVVCARRLERPGSRIEFVLAGGLLMHTPTLARLLASVIRRQWRRASVRVLSRESAWGAIELARRALAASPESDRPDSRGRVAQVPRAGEVRLARSTRLPVTERRNPHSRGLDRMAVRDAVNLMIREDARLTRALRRETAGITRAVRLISAAFRRGGRLFYVGAGTSGRLGVLDASECPPTFCTDPERVQGIIAGGQQALWRSAEGAEDDAEAGAEAVRLRGVRNRDVVVGIAASGTTPFVWGALAAARDRRVRTVLVCCNPNLQTPQGSRPDVVIAPDVGPEVLTGSTRLKAGTATKMILNMLTTLAMVRCGKVLENLMIDLNPSNTKLRERAVRIVCQLRGLGAAQARAALERHGWNVRTAVRWLSRGQRASR
jgi:N-acetylmuramic acid 6-phosphate etherase